MKQRASLVKKPKVAPVVAKALKSAMKSMNIGEKKKITMADSSNDEDSAEEEQKQDFFAKPISKKKGMSR